MVLDMTKKPARMLFTIENLAKSSRDEKSEDNQPAIVSFNDCALTPLKLQTSLTPLTSTPLSLPLAAPDTHNIRKRKRHNSIESEQSSFNSSDSKSRDCPTPNSTTDESKSRDCCTPNSTTSDSDSSSSEGRKKSRAAFTNRQINELEKCYTKSKYLPIEQRAGLAQKLKLSEQQIKTWFQNRRMKEKRQVKDSKTLGFPSGGVDIKQLAAYGIPCPPPHNITSTQSTQLPGHINTQYTASPQMYDTRFMSPYMYGYTQLSPVVYPGYTHQYYNGLSPQNSSL